MYSMLKTFLLVCGLLRSDIQAQRRIEVHTIKLSQDLCIMSCLSGWSYFNYTCLRVINETMIWIEAELFCRSLVSGGHLVSIHSKKNNDFVLNLVQNANITLHNVWLGSSDFYKDGVLLWTDGSQRDYHNWLLGKHVLGLHCHAMKLNGENRVISTGKIISAWPI
ncbi:hypothetical protein chiPu_0002789 [Chiloscyllium punctatum]|uniref:C-type lectin domain-containing protein n=1 Tax=Chiloscyllium punctatum TaxID=137246 RepID=A0A401S1W9_CHIPU|nr:hypothetical protein [Chiloscyllium punctatum]